jgi:hypothetical protein
VIDAGIAYDWMNGRPHVNQKKETIITTTKTAAAATTTAK